MQFSSGELLFLHPLPLLSPDSAVMRSELRGCSMQYQKLISQKRNFVHDEEYCEYQNNHEQNTRKKMMFDLKKNDAAFVADKANENNNCKKRFKEAQVVDATYLSSELKRMKINHNSNESKVNSNSADEVVHQLTAFQDIKDIQEVQKLYQLEIKSSYSQNEVLRLVQSVHKKYEMLIIRENVKKKDDVCSYIS